MISLNLRQGFLLIVIILSFFLITKQAFADKKSNYDERMLLYKKMEALTQIKWYYFAAVDQYERSVRQANKDIPDETGKIAIYYSPEEWTGPLNPNKDDTDPVSISIFGGAGRDGNGDGKADRENDEDVLYTFASHLQSYGSHHDDIKIGLWDHYKRDLDVRIIMGHAKVFKQSNSIKLEGNAFPLPLHANYTIKNSWGARRGWGGIRIHEGSDIFAGYGVPVRATTHGIIEVMGWNRYGGWRIGIRDLNNTYHYYAHLSGFEKGIEKGTVVKPGDTIGYVGSTGYGPKGTAGKFPPHLHYGLYRYTGNSEWSFDPYPKLKAWEREERQKKEKD